MSIRTFVIVVALLATGCTQQTLTQPPPVGNPYMVPLTVYTRWYAVHPDQPVSGVSVRIDGQLLGLTDENGALDVLAPAGREITVSVEREPYRPMVPWVASTLQLESHERWTFYFER